MIFCIDTQFVNDVKNDRQVYVRPRQSDCRRGAFGLDNAAPEVMFKDKFIPIEQYYYILSWFGHGAFTGTMCYIF